MANFTWIRFVYNSDCRCGRGVDVTSTVGNNAVRNCTSHTTTKQGH